MVNNIIALHNITPPQSPSDDNQRDAGRNLEVKGGREMIQLTAVDSDHKDDGHSLGEVDLVWLH